MTQISRPEARRLDVLQCVTEHAEHELNKLGITQAQAVQVATSIGDRLVEMFSGQIISFPKNYSRKLQERNAQIFAEFTGSNQPELARKYGLTERAVRKVIARLQTEAQAA